MDNKSQIKEEEKLKALDILNKICAYYDTKIVGQQGVKFALLVAFMSNGHVLLESVPGLAKTTAAKTLTEAVNGSFSKIQCTPDLLPSDIVGTQIFNYKTNKFDTILGPVNANFVLLDEINRSSAKTQSAMLEAMQERKVSVGGETYAMPKPFIVIATQNPIEQEGTYLLPEAQMDRFLLKEVLTYPSKEEELEIINRIENKTFDESESLFKPEDILFLQSVTERVYIDDSIKKYIVEIINATRYPHNYIKEEYAKYIEMGSSPRGTIALMQVSKAIALLHGRDYVTPDDVKNMIHSVLRHRIALNYTAVADDVKVETIIDAITGAIVTP